MKNRKKLLSFLAILVIGIYGITHWMVETVEAHEPKMIQLDTEEKNSFMDKVSSHYDLEDNEKLQFLSAHEVDGNVLIIIEIAHTDYFFEFENGKIIHSGVHG